MPEIGFRISFGRTDARPVDPSRGSLEKSPNGQAPPLASVGKDPNRAAQLGKTLGATTTAQKDDAKGWHPP
jgi:hypothetical protein